MPYIITTSEPFDAAVHVDRPAFSRTAVATLDEARDDVAATVERITDAHDDYAEMYSDAQNLPESGGTVGPLPDGTVIEVRPVTLAELYAQMDNGALGLSESAVIAAFNAADRDPWADVTDRRG